MANDPASDDAAQPKTDDRASAPAPERTFVDVVSHDDAAQRLVAAVNDASGAARASWFAFLAFTGYLFIAVAGVSHQDLLLNAPAVLPLANVAVDLDQFFRYAPIVYAFVHFGVLSQHLVLSQKLRRLDDALAAEETDGAVSPARDQLHTHFLTQAAAGPRRGALLSRGLDAVTWISFAVIPLILLVFFHTAFLAFHDLSATWTHRAVLLFSALVVLFMTSALGARGGAARALRIGVAALIGGAATLFAFLVATVPGERLDRAAAALWPAPAQLSGARGAATGGIAGGFDRVAFAPTAWLFEGAVDPVSGRVASPFSRNLVVTDAALSAEDAATLRGRDLRFATLDRTDLSGADLTGANLLGASLSGTVLDRASLFGADLRGTRFWREGALDFEAEPARAIGADFRRARMEGADLHGAVAPGARFGGATLAGAVFLAARLEGADFQGAQLLGVNFTGASLEAARFEAASLVAVDFAGADLRGASFYTARLQFSDLAGARVAGADFRGAALWRTRPPEDLSETDARWSVPAPIPAALQLATQAVETAVNPDLRAKLRAKLGAVLTAAAAEPPGGDPAWPAGPEGAAWMAAMARSNAWGLSETTQLTTALAGLGCADLTPNGAIVNALARRGGALQALNFAPLFNGDPAALARAFAARGCPASDRLDPDALRDLRRAANPPRPPIPK